MMIEERHDDAAILGELGKRLAQRRLDLELTQAVVADQAGVSKRTVERMEAGATVQLSNFIRILRVLDLLDALDRLLPEPGPRPLDLLKLKSKSRQRAPSPHGVADKDDTFEWHWGD